MFLRIFGMVLSFLSAAGVAFFFGTTAIADAFFFARRTMGSLTLMFEGIAEMVMVPGLVRRARERGFHDVMAYTARIETKCYVISIPLCIGVFIYSDVVLAWIAPGLAPEAVDAAGLFLSLMIVTVPIVIATSISGAALASLGVFSLSVSIRLLPRIAIVLALLLVPFGMPMVGVVVAFVIGSFAMLAGFIAKRRMIIRIAPDITIASEHARPLPAINRTRNWAIGIIAASHMVQTTMETYYASLAGVGALVILVVGQRVSNIGMNEVMRSLLSVYYTNFARHALSDDPTALNAEIGKGLCTSAFYVFPIAACLYTTAVPMAAVFLDFGAFDRSASILTGQFISVMAVVVALRAILGIFETAILASGGVPHLRIMGTVLSVGLVVRLISLEMTLSDYGILSIAISSLATSAVIIAGYLFWLRRTMSFAVSWPTLRSFVIISLTAAAAGLLARFLFDVMGHESSKLVQAIQLTFSTGMAAAFYLGTTRLFQIEESTTLIAPVTRRLRRKTKT